MHRTSVLVDATLIGADATSAPPNSNSPGLSGSLSHVLRLATLLLLSALAGAVCAQPTEGTYRAPGSPPASWRINEHHALIWDGSPYLPVGMRVTGSPDRIAEAKSAGVNDLILELPANGVGWEAAFKAADDAGMRYLLCVNSLAPTAKGIVVEPQGYRVRGITEKRSLSLQLPGASRALVVLITDRDGVVESTQLLPVTDGLLRTDVEPRNSLDHTLLVYPEMASLDLPDFWEGFDRHRDALIGALLRQRPGRGLRGILNPLGALVRLATRGVGTIPTSPFFRDEFQNYLEVRYRNVETNQRAWSMSSSPITSFEQMARLVPLWNGAKGVSLLWDPVSEQTFVCNSKYCSIWSDLQITLGSIAARRYNRLAAAIRATCDVPVVQEWAGWAAPYESSSPALDGVGMRVTGTSPSEIAASAGRATSSLLRWSKAGWLLATEVVLTGAVNPPESLLPVLDDLASLGARGWFVRSTTPALSQAIGAESARRSVDTSFAQWSPSAVYFPENATNPAVAQRLPGGSWWLPSPANGNRIDLGSDFFGYRYESGSVSFIALWTLRGTARVQLRMLDPKVAQFASADGTDPQPKFNRKGVEVTIRDVPLLITGTTEIPVPEPALNETIQRFDQLLGIAEAQGKDAAEERFFFRDALNGMDRNPSGSFSVLRQQTLKLNLKLATFTWIEAETSRNNTFSEALPVPGCSNGAVLSLQSRLNPGPEGYYAEYSVPVKSDAEQEVWLAASIPTGTESIVRVFVGGQTMTLTGESVGRYGSGYGWYRLGTTRLAGGTQKLRVQVDAPRGAEIALDAIMLSPTRQKPSGVTPPEIVSFQPPPRRQP